MSGQAGEAQALGTRRGYTLGEEIANGTTHGVGVGLAVAGLVILPV